MKETEYAGLLVEYCHRLYERGFMPGMDGNVSVRAGDTVYITPSGAPKYSLKEKDLVRLSLTGERLSEGKPSSEAEMHLAVLRSRKDAGAVIHAHSPNIGAFVLAEKMIDTRCAPFAYLHIGEIGEVPYITPGSRELHKAVEAAASKGYHSLLLMKHGSLVIGESMDDAYNKLDLLESYANMLIGAYTLGGAKPLSKEELKGITHG